MVFKKARRLLEALNFTQEDYFDIFSSVIVPRFSSFISDFAEIFYYSLEELDSKIFFKRKIVLTLEYISCLLDFGFINEENCQKRMSMLSSLNADSPLEDYLNIISLK